ncbi:MAG: formate dehydrogenase accessory sulfurtransferase FdhD [marine benthic group bacterium]|nr:formate dehydrogenase accessory sulfurtransferase FdhD [Gemmatimonadota bacterium]
MTVERDSKIGTMKVLAPEALVRVRVNESYTLEWSCTPRDLSCLATGWFVSEGIVRTPGEIEDLSEVDSGTGYAVCLSVRLARPALARLAAALSGDTASAVRPAALTASVADREPDTTGGRQIRSLLEDRGRVTSWFRDMFDQAALRSSVGGVHTGGLVVEGNLAQVVEDVSRHHVVDRLVGSAVLTGAVRVEAIFLVSARISGAMAAKACRAGIGALVSRSVPTELAAAIAAPRGLILVGRARGEAPHYYWPASDAAG